MFATQSSNPGIFKFILTVPVMYEAPFFRLLISFWFDLYVIALH